MSRTARPVEAISAESSRARGMGAWLRHLFAANNVACLASPPIASRNLLTHLTVPIACRIGRDQAARVLSFAGRRNTSRSISGGAPTRSGTAPTPMPRDTYRHDYRRR